MEKSGNELFPFSWQSLYDHVGSFISSMGKVKKGKKQSSPAFESLWATFLQEYALTAANFFWKSILLQQTHNCIASMTENAENENPII